MKQTFFTICLASIILTGCVTARETKDCHFSTTKTMWVPMEKLHVLNIDTTSYGHTFGAAPFFLVVKTKSGKEGLIPYSSEYFYESNPIK